MSVKLSKTENVLKFIEEAENNNLNIINEELLPAELDGVIN